MENSLKMYDDANDEEKRNMFSELMAIHIQRKEKHRESMRKYQQSIKGKATQKKANSKYYKPTGKPRGRPKKNI